MASVQSGTIFVKLTYSNDGGSTWLPASPTNFRVARFALTVPVETVLKQDFEYKQRVRKIRKGRPKLVLELDSDQFGAVHDSTDAKLNEVEDWLRGALLRVFTNDGAASPAGIAVEGRTYFNTSTNTNYVEPESDNPEADIVTSFRKSFKLVLIARDTL